MMPFQNLSQDVLNHMLPGQRAMQDTLLATDSEVVTSGAISTTSLHTDLSVTGTQAYTLADGPAGVAGMKKIIRCTVAATTPAGTLTIASPETLTGFVCSATFFFDTVGQMVELIWSGTKWRAHRIERAGTSGTITVGTTVLTGKNLWKTYTLSVTNTVSSTGTQAFPNGSAMGEEALITNSAVSGTPVGSIDGVYTGFIAEAYTHLGAIGVIATASVTGDYALLRWTGAAWQVVNQSGCTLS
jgi:hypothetical protein